MREIYDFLENLNAQVSGFVWGPAMIALMLLTGLYFSAGTGFMQLRHFAACMKKTFFSLFQKKEKKKDGNQITQFQALATALAGTMGTGNIVGVATALTLGGPGAVFWMWVSALLGMMTKYAETLLAVKYRRKEKDGHWVGGAMEYIEHGLGQKWLASLFCVFCVLASFGMGNMTQANSIAEAMGEAFAAPPALSGALVAVLLALVIFGGISRIAQVAEKIIPLLSLLYLAGGLAIIVCHAGTLPQCISSIFEGAFSLPSAAGGIGGYGITQAMRYGVSRGIFSNEAGLGSSGMVYASSEEKEPVVQGMWGIFEVFADTIVVCTITAIAILTSGAMQTGKDGAALSAAAFESVFGSFGGVFVSVSIVLFAFASMLGWAFYGERSFSYLTGGHYQQIYRFLFVAVAIPGSIAQLGLVWDLSETFNGLMAIPNLVAILLLSGTVFRATREYWSNCRLKARPGGAKKTAGVGESPRAAIRSRAEASPTALQAPFTKKAKKLERAE